MKNAQKRFLAIGLLIVLILAVAGLAYLSLRTSTLTPVAPTAPASQPHAAAATYTEAPNCSASFTVAQVCTLVPPKWSDWGDCTKSCGGGTQTRTCTPGTCGGETNCDNLDGGNATRACNTEKCETNISIDKTAYQDESTNTVGSYSLKQEIDTVSKNQTYVYTITVKNNATQSAEGVTITDPLTGLNQEQLTFKDVESSCTWDLNTKAIHCTTSFDPGQEKKFSFRVTVSDGAVNGMTIKNNACANYQSKDVCAEKDLNVSTVVSCNHTCTSDAECGGELVCDTTSNKCRNSSCLSIESCICSVPKPSVTTTPKPTILPESGIMDVAGVAAFGGGLLLTVVGILLAL